MFAIGDTVMYGTQGVCRIVGTDRKRLRDREMEYLILRPVYDENFTLFVPLANERLTSKMHSILSADEAVEMIDKVIGEDTVWISDDALRRETQLRTISSGDRLNILRMIKSIHLHRIQQEEKGRTLHQSDENILRQAEKLVYDELAVVLGKRPDEILPYILEKSSA